MQMFLLDADYVYKKDKTLVRLFGIDKEGNKLILLDDSVEPYFFINFVNKQETVNRIKNSKYVKGISKSQKNLLGKETDFLVVKAAKKSDLKKIRDIVKHKPFINKCYEYTLNHYKRYLRDKKLTQASWVEFKPNGKPRKIGNLNGYSISDIKSGKRGSIPDLKVMAVDIEFVDDRIVLLSFAVDESSPKVISLGKAKGADIEAESEKDLIERFVEIVKKEEPHIITGYNSDQFDFSIIRERAKKLKVKLDISSTGKSIKALRRGRISAMRIEGIVHLDLFHFISNILAPQLNSEILTLNEVAGEIVGEGKEEPGYEKIIMLWREGPREKLVDYSRNDAYITLKLSRAVVPQILALSEISGEIPFDANRETYGLLVDNYLVQRTVDFNEVALNHPKFNEIKKRRSFDPFKGGFVVESKPGLHDDVAVFDFRSLYPSIIVTFNISPETLNCNCCKEGKAHPVPGLKHRFCAKKKGFIPACIEDILKERFQLKEKLKGLKKSSAEYKETKEREGALKVLANASYGYLAFTGARWYSRECAESAASFGRYFIKKALKKAEDYGEVIYGDTDSLFVKIEDKNIAAKFLKDVNDELPGLMELELEGFYNKALFSYTKEGKAAKKRYALLDKSGNLVIRGFETVRKDWCKMARNLQREVLKLILNDKREKAEKTVKEKINKLKKREINLKELALTAQLGKKISSYKQIGPHVSAAKKLINRGYEISEGTQIQYVITEGEGSISDRAQPLEFVSLNDYDIDYYLERQLIPAALRPLSALGYKKETFAD